MYIPQRRILYVPSFTVLYTSHIDVWESYIYQLVREMRLYILKQSERGGWQPRTVKPISLLAH